MRIFVKVADFKKTKWKKTLKNHFFGWFAPHKCIHISKGMHFYPILNKCLKHSAYTNCIQGNTVIKKTNETRLSVLTSSHAKSVVFGPQNAVISFLEWMTKKSNLKHKVLNKIRHQLTQHQPPLLFCNYTKN